MNSRNDKLNFHWCHFLFQTGSSSSLFPIMMPESLMNPWCQNIIHNSNTSANTSRHYAGKRINVNNRVFWESKYIWIFKIWQHITSKLLNKRHGNQGKFDHCRWHKHIVWKHSHMTKDVFGYFWPTYPNQILYYISLFSKIRCSLTYLPT